ncbi:folylpolyglutamate synthase, mitochondrial-like isoform X2 [Hetaerina americana]|uniref:folylpolyglutamate synthase, mitochondrial-like isoform X2 n=1 Tax=Hetaerina americana TaxID=62018 RepID=UPI003A7F53E9
MDGATSSSPTNPPPQSEQQPTVAENSNQVDQSPSDDAEDETASPLVHPAPLPEKPPVTNSNENWKRPPPKLLIKLYEKPEGAQVSWHTLLTPDHEEIAKYELYSYKEGTQPPSTSLWQKLGDIVPSTLPMACTLSQEAVKALNLLQTNASVLQEVREKRKQGLIEKNENVSDTRKFLARSGISLDELDSLPVIHVAGTKGKGSTCAFCESMLRHYGMEKMNKSFGRRGMLDLPSTSIQTGLYTSPHLIEVRERIQLNGKPISYDLFTLYFWKVYNTLMEKREHERDMPPYFKFLTVLALNIFIREGVDVAVIEVGIGGENDCTNVIRKPVAVGITNIGIDHENILGKTLDKIAWQKAGIMKKGSPAFTAHGQAPVALDVLEERAKENEVMLKVCPPLSSYSSGQLPLNVSLSSPVQEVNASLALQLSNAWIKWSTKSSNDDADIASKHLHMASPFELDMGILKGLKECKWPGRTQILPWQDSGITFFLDGAHTVESIKICLEWFRKESHAITTIGSNACNGDAQGENNVQEVTRILLFNSTGNRNIEPLLEPFAKSTLFHCVLFSPNIPNSSIDMHSDLKLRPSRQDGSDIIDPGLLQCKDQMKVSASSGHTRDRCQEHQEVWLKHNHEAQVYLYSCVTDALASVKNLPSPCTSGNTKKKMIHVLVSGSLHLVGSVLSIVDPDLSYSLSQQGIQNHDTVNVSSVYRHAQGSNYLTSPA